jgi:hypothetical protein
LPADSARQLTVALKAIAKEDAGPSDAAVPVRVVPVIETPNGSLSSASVALSSSAFVADAQLVPDNRVPGIYVTVEGNGSLIDTLAAVALPELDTIMQYRKIAVGKAFGFELLTPSFTTVLTLVTLSVVCGLQKMMSWIAMN